MLHASQSEVERVPAPAKQIEHGIEAVQQTPVRCRRRGESIFDGIGALVVLILIGGGIWWFVAGQGSFPPNLRAMTEPPVRVNLQGFVFSQGYYVFIFNTHETVILEGVSVEYTDVNGKKRTQAIGSIRPKESRRLDPSEVKWRVERGESISIISNGYLTKTVTVNSLLD